MNSAQWNLLFDSPNVSFPTIFGYLANLPLTDSKYHLIIQQQCETIKHLSTQWATPLASSARYDSRAHEATKLAESLSGLPPTTKDSDLQSLPPARAVVCHVPTAADPDNDLEEDSEYESEDPALDNTLAPEAVVLGDIIMDGGDNEEEEDSEDSHLEPTVLFHWKVLEVSHSPSELPCHVHPGQELVNITRPDILFGP